MEAFDDFRRAVRQQRGYKLSLSPSSSSSATTSSSSSPSPSLAYFTLTVTICGVDCEFGVIFDAEQGPSVAPDFMLPQGQEFAVSLDALSALRSWNGSTSHFVEVVDQLVAAYKEYHRQLVTQHSDQKIQMEGQMAAGITGSEFYVSPNPNSEVHMSIPVEMSDSSSEEQWLLYVTFVCGRSSTPTTRLIIPKSAEALVSKVHLPVWRANVWLVDYLPQVTQSLQKSLSSVDSRRKLCQALAKTFGTPAEYDSVGFHSIAFTFTHQDMDMIVVFSPSSEYPQKCPKLSMKSFRHAKTNGKPFSVVLNAPEDYYPKDSPSQHAKVFQRLMNQLFTQFCDRTVRSCPPPPYH